MWWKIAQHPGRPYHTAESNCRRALGGHPPGPLPRNSLPRRECFPAGPGSVRLLRRAWHVPHARRERGREASSRTGVGPGCCLRSRAAPAGCDPSALGRAEPVAASSAAGQRAQSVSCSSTCASTALPGRLRSLFPHSTASALGPWWQSPAVMSWERNVWLEEALRDPVAASRSRCLPRYAPRAACQGAAAPALLLLRCPRLQPEPSAPWWC